MLLKSLLPGFHIRSLSPPLITDVLSLIGHSLPAGRMLIPRKTSSNLFQLRTLLEHAMLNIIETDEAYTAAESRVLTAFCNWISGKRARYSRPAGIISANYDIAVERELFGK